MDIHSIYFLQGMHVTVDPSAYNNRKTEKYLLSLSTSSHPTNPVYAVVYVNLQETAYINLENQHFGLFTPIIIQQLLPVFFEHKHEPEFLMYFKHDIYFTIEQEHIKLSLHKNMAEGKEVSLSNLTDIGFGIFNRLVLEQIMNAREFSTQTSTSTGNISSVNFKNLFKN